MVKQPGHLTSMKKDRGVGTRVLGKIVRFFVNGWAGDVKSYLELVLAGLGLRRWVQEINCKNLGAKTLVQFPQ